MEEKNNLRCAGHSETLHLPCGEPPVSSFVLSDHSIRPRNFCQAHAVRAREVMARRFGKNEWREEPLVAERWRSAT